MRMNYVKVKKGDLLEKLKANRQKHEQEYKEALQGFQETVVESLTTKAVELKAKPPKEDVQVFLQAPQEYLEQYDQAIAMLEWSTQDEVELNGQEFAQYVLDKWSWKDQFAMSNTGYMEKARASKTLRG